MSGKLSRWLSTTGAQHHKKLLATTNFVITNEPNSYKGWRTSSRDLLALIQTSGKRKEARDSTAAAARRRAAPQLAADAAVTAAAATLAASALAPPALAATSNTPAVHDGAIGWTLPPLNTELD